MPMVSAMAILRSLKTGTREHRDPRKLALHAVLVIAASLAVVLALAAAPAGAVVTTVGPTKVGLQPREAESFFEGTPTVESFDNPEGSPVLHKNETYAIYWDPTDHYHGDWQHLIDTFLQGLGTDSGSTGTVFAVDSQYTDRSNLPASYLSTFRGAYTDTDPYPVGVSNCEDPRPLAVPDRIGPETVKGSKVHTEVCLTDAQVRKELKAFIAAHSLQKGVGSIFYLLTPPGVTVCLDKGEVTGHCSDYAGTLGEKSYKNSFCSYHSDFSNVTLENVTTPDANTILYGVIPWSAGGLGDYHLTPSDQTPAYDCQDGGFDPTSNPIEEKEHVKVTPQEEEAKRLEEEAKKRASAEEEEAKKQTTYEEAYKKGLITEAEREKKTQELKEEKEARIKREEAEEKKAEKVERETQEKKAKREGPHQQEPNQDGLGPDGSYDTGLADLIASQIGVQQQNIVTDPLLNAWQDSAHNEVTDECRNFFASAPGSVTALEPTFAGTLFNQSFAGANAYINDAFNLAAGRLPYPGVPCLNSISLVPQFTAPNPVNTGELVGFDGMESDITLNDDIGYSKTGVEEPKYATYKWNFGDGSPEVTGFAPGAPSLNSPENSPCEFPWKAPCAASTYHSYQYGETYNVTLTVTDTGGNTTSVTEPITVVGPPRPSSTTPTGGPSAPGSPAPATPQAPVVVTPALTPTPTVFPPPVLGAGVTSKSLKKALSSGLPVHYSANEQVAGSIQVLIESSTAKRLGIKGATATGLPAGTPRSVVVGTAVLVTTKAGQGTIRIKFSSQTASRLKHIRKLKVTLRLIARNASRQSPQTATLLSTVVLNP